MGYIATLVINMDALREIGEDKDFGRKVHDAILVNNEVDISCGPYISAATAVESHHASCGIPLIVGGYNWFHKVKDVIVPEGSADAEMALLKSLAAKHGFGLRKKPKNK